MKTHYGFSDSQMSDLAKKKVTEMDMFKAIKFFDPNNDGVEISQVSLFHYIDQKGNFNDPPFSAHKHIAKCVFDNLGIKQKIAVSEYLESWEEDFVDE